MPKKKNSGTDFEKKRLAMLRELTKNCKGEVIEKVIPFKNNDVLKFLARLDRFERRSRKIELIVGAPCIQC